MYSVWKKCCQGGRGGSTSTHNLWNIGGKIEKTTIGTALRLFKLKYVQIVPFYAFFNQYYGSIFEIALIINPLLFPYIAHEQTAQNLILSVCLSLFALFLKSLLRSLVSRFAQERRAIEQFQRAMCPALGSKCLPSLWSPSLWSPYPFRLLWRCNGLLKIGIRLS